MDDPLDPQGMCLQELLGQQAKTGVSVHPNNLRKVQAMYNIFAMNINTCTNYTNYTNIHDACCLPFMPAVPQVPQHVHVLRVA